MKLSLYGLTVWVAPRTRLETVHVGTAACPEANKMEMTLLGVPAAVLFLFKPMGPSNRVEAARKRAQITDRGTCIPGPIQFAHRGPHSSFLPT